MRALALGLALCLSSLAAAEGEHDLSRGFEALESWQFDEALGIAEALYRAEPKHPGVLALLADVKFHQGDYQGATHYFELAHQAGAPPHLLADAPLAEAARTATEGYVETVSDHFVIRHAPGKDAILVPYAVETLELALEKIGALLGFRPTARLIVEFYPSAATLAAVSTLTRREIETSGTIALCKWNRLMVTSPRAVLFGYSWRDTLAHELVHLIIGGASANTVPIWLHEGLAKYAETAWRDKPGLGLAVEQQRQLRDAAKKGTLIPFERMHPSMAKLKSQEETSLAFAEVFTFIEYMVAQKGWQAIRDVLVRMRAGQSEEGAIEAVFGSSLKALSQDWMATLKTRPVRKEGAELKQRELVVKDRPEAPDDSLHGLSKLGRRYARAADLLYTRGRLKAAQRELEKAYRETGSAAISARLARVALATGDLEQAEQAARRAAEATPDLPDPNLSLVEVLIRRGKGAEAAEPLERAIAMNPFDPRIHVFSLALLGEAGDPKKRAQHEYSFALLNGTRTEEVGSLGRGARVVFEGLPFSRVIIEPRDGEPAIATGMTTPTAPLDLRPGTFQVRLVPPTGPATVRTITVEAGGEGGPPQRIAGDPQGS